MGLQGNWLDERRRETEMSRRRFIGMSSLAAAVSAVGGAGFSASPAMTQPRLAEYPFSLGVASGDPAPESVVIWTRLAPNPIEGGGMPDRSVPVRWEIAEDESFRRVVRRGAAQATPELGHSVHVEVERLRPDREYFYRFRVGRAGGQTSPVGRTRTTPEEDAGISELSFAFASCSQFEHGYFTAYRYMSEEDLDLVFHLGDYIYEYGPNEYVAYTGNVRDHIGPEITTLDDYRNRYGQYKSDEDLQAAHAAFPWIMTWDDHEVDNNYADEIPEDGQSREAFLARRAAAYQAYYEHMPLRQSSMPRGADLRLYRSIPYGDLAEFNVLDTRQYRSDQPCGDEFGSNCEARLAPTQTLTGAEQERWLFDNFSRSTSRWNVLAQQVFFAQQDVRRGTGQGFNPDAWDGYVAARERIMRSFSERNVSNPVVLTGDVHANWANELKEDFANPDSRTLGAEFVTTSITSGGNGSDVRADTATILEENPHIKFFNDQRGYVRCNVTRDSWRTDYRVLPYVNRRGAEIFTRASFAIEDGNPEIRRLGREPLGEQDRSSSDLTEEDRAEAQRMAARRSRGRPNAAGR